MVLSYFVKFDIYSERYLPQNMILAQLDLGIEETKFHELYYRKKYRT